MRGTLANAERVSIQGVPTSAGLRWVPSLTSLAFLLPVALLYWQLGGPLALLNDPETGVHVRAGEWILTHRDIPRQDLFSFSIAGRPWCDWEWLSDVLYALLHRWAGLAAIAAFSLVLVCVTSVIVYRTACLHAHRMGAFAVTCLVMATTTIHWLARPHLFTWLLVAVFCEVIEQSRARRQPRLLLALPVLMVVWVNLHPGFLAGFLILAGWWAAETAQARLGGRREDVADERWSRWLTFAAVACFAATLANPYGFHLHQHVVSYLFSSNTVTAQVAEWLSPDFHNPRLHWLELLLPLGAAAGLWQGLRRRFAWCAVTLGWMHLTLVSVRNVPLFAIVCAAPLASLVEHVVGQGDFGFRLHHAEKSLILTRSRVGTLVCRALAGALLIAVVCTKGLRLGSASSLPVEAVAHVPAGRLFTTDRWADYLIYAEPGRQVFFDCRNDLYGLEFVSAYQAVLTASPGWQEVLGKYGLTVALVPEGSAISIALAGSPDWRLSYRDAVAAVYLRMKQ